MKFVRTVFSFIIFNLSFYIGFTQDYTSFEINDIPYETARNAINKTLSDLNLGGHVWKNKTSTESNFYYYTALMIKNRLKFKVTVEENKLNVSIFTRQYKSRSSWINNPAPMSKKQATKILEPIKNQILEETKSKLITENNKTIQQLKSNSQYKLEWSSEENHTITMKPYSNIKTQVYHIQTNYLQTPVNFYFPEIENIEITHKDIGNGKYQVALKIFEHSGISYLTLGANQNIENNKAIARKKIKIDGPYYFFFPDFENYKKLNIISETEYRNLTSEVNNCADEINDKGNISIINSQFCLSSLNHDAKRFFTNIKGELKNFVKPAPCINKKWFGLNDKQNIILLAHEAMDKIKLNEEKIKTLQKSAELILENSQNFNDKRILKISSDIKYLEDSLEQIREEYGNEIHGIAEKGTIYFPFSKTDSSSCYYTDGVKVIGAHWENKSLTILLSYIIHPNTCKEKNKYNMDFEGYGIREVSCKYLDKNNNEISRGTILNISDKVEAGICFSHFEKISLIDYFRSVPLTISN